MNPNKLLQEIDMIQKAKAIVASKLSTLDQRLTEMEFSSDVKTYNRLNHEESYMKRKRNRNLK